MKKILLILSICCFVFSFIAVNHSYARPSKRSNNVRSENSDKDLTKAIRTLRGKIKEHQARGDDVSKARELDRKAREAIRNGDKDGGLRLINEAINILDNGDVNKAAEKERPKVDNGPTKFKKKRVELPVSADKIIITRAVPLYGSGKEIKDYAAAFNSNSVDVEDGKVALDLTTVPIFVEEEGIQPAEFVQGESPFGIHGIKKWNSNAEELGIKWIRFAGPEGVTWDIVEPEKGKFDWSKYDNLYLEPTKNNVGMFITIKSGNSWDQGITSERKSSKGGDAGVDWEQGITDDRSSKKDKRGKKDRVKRKKGEKPDKRTEGKKQEKKKRGKAGMPNDMEAYKNFISNMVERYDGDGKDDAPGSPVIKYWQVQNEVDGSWGDTPQNYAVLLKTTYKAIKEADPEAKIGLAGVMTRAGFKKFYIPMFEHLNTIKDNSDNRYFDVFDFHWGGAAGSYLKKSRRGSEVYLKEYVEEIRSTLRKYNSEVPLWITETSSYSGQPETPPNLPEQTEEIQAAELIKLYVYPLSLDIKKIFWVSLKEWGGFGGRGLGYFKKVGLINNPKNEGMSHKKLSFYTYKKLIEKLGGVDLDNIQTIDLGENVYCYKFMKNGKFIYVLWYDDK
ncbi:MAG TPA: hypothetical protein ENH40_02140 [Nitrospirae bacterium]|nr:hypothetical protein [Nitrospirota bacterium]